MRVCICASVHVYVCVHVHVCVCVIMIPRETRAMEKSRELHKVWQ